MSTGHPPRALKDGELLAALSTIVRKSNEVTAEFVEHLAELDQRQLHLELGYPSLFAYCVESLGLCEATAGRRIAVARVCRKYPDALTRVASGALHVSALCLLKQYLSTENATELFDLCTRKSARRVEQLLAARFPKPDLRDSIRCLPARPSGTLSVESAALGASTDAIQRSNSIAIPAGIGDVAATSTGVPRSESAEVRSAEARGSFAAQRLEPLSADRFGVRFTADSEFCELLERIRGLTGHRLPSGDLLTLLKRGLQAYEREMKKERFSVGRKPRASRRAAPKVSPDARVDSDSASTLRPSPSPSPTRSATRKRPAAAVVREVYVRDAGRCTFISRDGRRCSACKFLEVDHAIPWALGGDDSPANLRLRCRAHNQWHAQQCFGAAAVQAAVRRARRRADNVER